MRVSSRSNTLGSMPISTSAVTTRSSSSSDHSSSNCPEANHHPKASSEAHVRDNHAALKLTLSPDELAELDRTFPPPKRATPLAMI